MATTLPIPTPAPVRLREFVTTLRDTCADQAAQHPHQDLAVFAATIRDLCAAFLETD